MRVAINAWFWDRPSVGSGQYLKYLVPAMLEIDDSLEITLVSPKPFDGAARQSGALDAALKLKFQVAETPFSNQ